MDLLSRREHTVRELRHKLTSRGFDHAVTDGVLETLVAKDYLSDIRFAESFVRLRTNKGYGELDIRARLAVKGVSAETVSQVLAEQTIDWKAHAVSVLQKKYKGQSRFHSDSARFDSDTAWFDSDPARIDSDSAARRAKYGRFLQSRGFSAEQIISALAALNSADEAT